MLVDDDGLRVAAVGDAARVLVGRIEGQRHVGAELLVAVAAMRAGQVGVDHAADGGQVARLDLGDAGADPGHPADDLVARHDRVDRRHDVVPLVADHVQVRMADPAEEDLDLDVAFAGLAALDGDPVER